MINVREITMQALEKKLISITSERQLTIPQEFYMLLGFENEAICTLVDGALIIEPASHVPTGEFDDCILTDLIEEGYEGKNLLAEFKVRRSKIRPAIEKLIHEADNVSRGIGEYFTYEDVFGE